MAILVVSISSFGQALSRSVENSEELQSIVDFVQEKGDFKEEFNFKDIKIIHQKENPKAEIIVINRNDFNLKNHMNSALTIFYQDKSFGEAFILKTTKKNKTNLISEYFSLENKLLFSATLNPVNKDIAVTYATNSTSGCGQATMDCIEDAYSNHGWVSVWTWVQSAFIPQTAAAIAIACAGINCL